MYNASGSPRMYAPIVASMAIFLRKFGWSLGVGISQAVQTIFTELNVEGDQTMNYLDGINIAYGISACFFIALGIIAIKLGVYSWERGKCGFHEYKCLNFDTFPELQMHDPEMISLDRFEDEPSFDEIEYKRSRTRSVWRS